MGNGNPMRRLRGGLPRFARKRSSPARSRSPSATATRITLRRPYVDPALCIGCGICEHECPVTDEAAIRVTAIGETRSRDRRLLMDGGDTSAVREYETRQR